MSTILVADDDAIVRKIVAPILERSGFTVLVAADGTAAMECARRHESVIEVLVSDVEIPGLSGIELAARLSESRPDIKVLLISTTANVPTDLRNGWRFLRKPFPPAVLLENLTELTTPVAK